MSANKWKTSARGQNCVSQMFITSRDFTEEERNVYVNPRIIVFSFHFNILFTSTVFFSTQWNFPVKMNEDILTTLKILIIGESGVGKSRYVLRDLSLQMSADRITATTAHTLHELLIETISPTFRSLAY